MLSDVEPPRELSSVFSLRTMIALRLRIGFRIMDPKFTPGMVT